MPEPRYQILSAPYAGELEASVERKLEQGYLLAGGVKVVETEWGARTRGKPRVSTTFYQAVYRPAPTPTGNEG